MNNWSITGHVGRDAKIRQTSGGQSVANTTLAVSQFGKNAKPLWVKVKIWGKQADSLTPFLKKGKQIAVSGELGVSTWQDREGLSRTDIEINARQITLLGGGQNSSQSEQNEFDGPSRDEDIPF